MHAPTDTGSSAQVARGWWLLPALAFIAGSVLMALAARGDLAIDEVLSVQRALGVRTWLDIITQYPNDNNHLLNTFFLWRLGEQPDVLPYRLPALVFGIGTMAMLALAARRFGKTAIVWTLGFAALSFPIILYGSEARGYAPAMFFAVAAWELMASCHERRSASKLFLFWTALCLGFLAHFSFVMVCLALGFWEIVRDRMEGYSLRSMLTEAARYFALPAAFTAGLYWSYVRHMVVLGGMKQSIGTGVAETASYLLGFPGGNGWFLVSVPVAVLVICAGAWTLYRQQRGEWIFFLLILLGTPALVLGCWRSGILYYRYFAVCFPFFYLLLGVTCAEACRRGSVARIAVAMAWVLVTAGHLVKTADLLRWGRGNYRDALADMAAATPGPMVTIGSSNDFRNGTLVDFYARFVPEKPVRFISRAARIHEKPEWIILDCEDVTFPAYPDIDVADVGKYILFKTYPYGGSSGWAWYVYRLPSPTRP